MNSLIQGYCVYAGVCFGDLPTQMRLAQEGHPPGPVLLMAGKGQVQARSAGDLELSATITAPGGFATALDSGP